MTRQRSHRSAAATFPFLLLGAWGCGDEAPAPEPLVRPVKVQEIQAGSSGVIREYPGTVAAAQTAEMAFEVAGRIVEFSYKEGQDVADGAVLARLDPRDYQARLDSAQADFDNSRLNFERAQKLFEEGALSAIERDRRRTTMATNEATLREAEKALEDTELLAPFAGQMARKLVEDYQNVRAKQVVLILVDVSTLEIKLAIPERDMAGERRQEGFDPDAVTARTNPRVFITSMPEREFPARITEIATTADPDTRTFEATIAFEIPSNVQVLPGMTAKVVIDVPSGSPGSEGGVRIPASAAVADDEGKAFVWLVDPASNQVRPQPVELGELTGSQVIVRGGLSDGDLVAVSGVSQLRDGMAVRPVRN